MAFLYAQRNLHFRKINYMDSFVGNPYRHVKDDRQIR